MGRPEGEPIPHAGKSRRLRRLGTTAVLAAAIGATGTLAAPYVVNAFHHSPEAHASYVPSRDAVLNWLRLPTDGDALVVGEKERHDAAALTYNFLHGTKLWGLPASTGGTIGEGITELYNNRNALFVDSMFSTVSTDRTNDYLNTTIGLGMESFWGGNPIIEGSGINVGFFPFSHNQHNPEKDRTVATVYLTVTPKGYESGWGSNVFTQQTAREYITDHFGKAYKYVEFDSPYGTSPYVLAVDGNTKVQLGLNGRLNYTTIIPDMPINYPSFAQGNSQAEVAAQVGYALAKEGFNGADQIGRIVSLDGYFSPKQIASLVEISNTDPLANASGRRYTDDLTPLQSLINAATPLLSKPMVSPGQLV